MSSIRIKAQALEKKTVKLHWFGNVRQDVRNNWRLGIAFEDKNQLIKNECPIGLLPMLRIGQWYHNGTPMATQKEGMIGAVTIPAGTAFQQDTSLAVCRRFQYYLYRDAELIKQQMLSFTVHGTTYHIPQIEIIRALFALHKVCSNAMLRPNGLSLLINQASIQNQELNIVFAKEIPVSTLTDAFVHHIGWILSNADVRTSFESIYMQVYQQGMYLVANKTQNIHQGDIYVSRQGRGGATVKGGVDESIVGGKLQPIDVQSLDVQESKSHGLEQFLQMIHLMRSSYPELTISVSLIDLPLGRKFSLLPDGHRRKCAVVRVERNSKTTYILEVACPDGHSLSTLLLYPISKEVNINEKYIRKILQDLIYNKGHWNYKRIRGIDYRKLKHNVKSLDDWNRRLYQIIN